jgi:hypothetical protein
VFREGNETMTAHTLFSWIAVIAGLLSGLLWLYAALIRIPTEKLGSGFGTLVGVEDVAAAFKRQTLWNACAATATGVAALLQVAAGLTAPG